MERHIAVNSHEDLPGGKPETTADEARSVQSAAYDHVEASPRHFR
jgi:hypothetical protein